MRQDDLWDSDESILEYKVHQIRSIKRTYFLVGIAVASLLWMSVGVIFR